MGTLKVGVVGATGLVGSEMVSVLESRKFPLSLLRVLATAKSKGQEILFNNERLTVEETSFPLMKELDLVLFAGGDSASEAFGKDLATSGTVVVDNSSFFRMEPWVPLVVPEVNPEALKGHRGLIANPNCSTIQMVVALKPILDAAGIERIVVSTYQSVSGTGKDAVEELLVQSREMLGLLEESRLPAGGNPGSSGTAPAVRLDGITRKVYPKPIAFNLFPHIDQFDSSGFTKEELKMVRETKKIFGNQEIKISATTVRVPVMKGHAEAVYVETEKKITADELRSLLSKAPGVIVMDDPTSSTYPTPLECAGRDEVFVGRIREDLDHPRGIHLWVVADNIRKGAALNAVQIAEEMLKRGLIR